MLIQFSATNHRSLREKQTLSLVASGEASDDARLIACPEIKGAVLPVVAIYGANASGKSNVLRAMGFMQEAVHGSHRNWGPGEGVPWEPFLLSGAASGASSYEMHFIVAGTRYRYGFAASVGHVEEEWLHAWPNGKKQVWYERERDRFSFGKNLRGANETIRALTRSNSLFLSVAAENNHAPLTPVYTQFTTPQLVARKLPGQSFFPRQVLLVDLLLRRVERNARPTAETFAPIMALLGTADTGIIDMRAEVEGEPNSAFDGQALRFGRIDFKHRSKKGGHGWLPLAAESAGTLALLEVGMKLIDVFSVGGLLLVDELESSLHPALARHIVALFQDPVQNPKRAQLVFTTHDTNLLGSVVGEPALRRDQVWLTEKDDAGATTLYPLTDYRPRKEENLERGYLQGRYGAIPYYGRSSTSRRGRPRRTGETCGAR